MTLLEVDLHLTNRCNLTCAHCSVDSGPGRTEWSEMTLEDWLRIVDQIADLGCRRVDLTGGEPILFDGVERIIERATARGLAVEIQTNGWLASNQRLERLRRAGLETLVVSIDGNRPLHDRVRGRSGSHDAAHRAIRNAVRAGLRVRVTRVVIDERGCDEDIGAFLGQLEAAGADHLSINQFSPITPEHFADHRPIDPERWNRFCRDVEAAAATSRLSVTYQVAHAPANGFFEFIADETRCLIERRQWFLIRADGEVFPCYHFVHAAERSLGNVLRRPLDRIVSGRNLAWTGYEGVEAIPSGCAGCDLTSTCGGGCPSPGYLQHRQMTMRDERCAIDDGWVPVCPFIKRTAGTGQMTNIAPYYAEDRGAPT